MFSIFINEFIENTQNTHHNSEWVIPNTIIEEKVASHQKSTIEVQSKHKRVRSDANKIPK